MTFDLKTLPNGLTVITEVNRSHLSASIAFMVRTGARDETEVESGLSHFLEHMMFKGTSKRSSMEVTYELGNLAARANAYTSDEATVYYGTVLPEYVGGMTELLSDMLRPALDTEEFNVEKKVILEEIALYQDRPFYFFMERAIKDYFLGHPCGKSVLGSTESVSALTAEQMRNYFNRRYVPSNMALVAAGNFDREAFLGDAEKYCGGWSGEPAGRSIVSWAPTVIQREYRRKNTKQAQVALFTRGPTLTEDERYPLSLLSFIHGDSSGSTLYWDLIESGIAESASVDIEEKADTGSIAAFATTEPEKLDEVSARLKKIVSDPMAFKLDDLERARAKVLTRIVLNGELPYGRFSSLGNDWLAGRSCTTLSEVMERIRNVTLKDIESAVAKYPWTSWSEFRLLPE